MDNFFARLERICWEQLKAFSGIDGNGVYKQGGRTETVDAIPLTPTANCLVFGEYALYDNSRVFEIPVADLRGISPTDGDTLTVAGTEHKVCKSSDGPCWLPVGAYGITIQVHTRTYR